MKLKKGDLIIVIILLVAIVGWFSKDLFLANDGNNNAVIKIDGQIYKTLSLQSNAEREEFKIDLPDDEFIHIIAENGQIWVEESSCPDQVCTITGKISKQGESIVCLPNKVIVFVEGEGEVLDDISS